MKEPKQIEKVYPLRDIPTTETIEQPTGGWQDGLPIAIDLGTYNTRVGYASDPASGPSHVFPTQVSKFRGRKNNRPYTLVGHDCYVDQAGRANVRSPFDGATVSNWEFVENILDYSFSKLTVKSQDSVSNPIVMSEMLGNPGIQRRGLNELLFEAYQVPSVAYGVDSLFSYRYNNGDSTGMVISSGNEATTIIPVLNGRGVLPLAKRINWGGRQASVYLQSLLQLKYPLFPLKVSTSQTSLLIHDHCYVSTDYKEEVSGYLDFEGLENRERIIQAPYTAVAPVEKSEEELARLAEKRKESGRRLQEQARKARLEKLVEKENNLEYYRDLQSKIEATTNKKDAKKMLDREGFRDNAALQKTIAELEKAIRKARHQDVGDDSETEQPPSFPLVDVPDDQLDEEQVKEKRRQKLLKGNYEARMRAKQEKEAEKQRQEEEAKKDAQWRERDLEGWLEDRRERLRTIFQNQRERRKLRENLNNRKSQASQMRMKNIAALASDSSRSKRRRGRGDDDDDMFGADDADWAVYKDIANETDSEEGEEEEKNIKQLQQELQEFDPTFNIDDYAKERGAIDWKDSVIHMFLRGPHEFDPESQAQQHQFALNVERIRVPEALFEPSIAGIDQAGIIEICDDILVRRLSDEFKGVTENVFLTGGLANFQNLDTRVYNELRSILPVGTPLKVKRATDPSLDAWRGMAQWALTDSFKKSCITRKDYEEMGGEYLKEHFLSNNYV
uniref:ARAD1C33858p n=1 Tax=Blastobotrys adeninivorans TaxID=409370 RepID=A0A060T2N0_BLAAD